MMRSTESGSCDRQGTDQVVWTCSLQDHGQCLRRFQIRLIRAIVDAHLAESLIRSIVVIGLERGAGGGRH